MGKKITLEAIKVKIRNKKGEIEERFEVKSLSLFGSYVRGEERRGSDIDILVEFKKTVSLLHIISLENYLTNLIGIKADVIPKKDLRKELKEGILREIIEV